MSRESEYEQHTSLEITSANLHLILQAEIEIAASYSQTSIEGNTSFVDQANDAVLLIQVGDVDMGSCFELTYCRGLRIAYHQVQCSCMHSKGKIYRRF